MNIESSCCYYKLSSKEEEGAHSHLQGVGLHGKRICGAASDSPLSSPSDLCSTSKDQIFLCEISYRQLQQVLLRYTHQTLIELW